MGARRQELMARYKSVSDGAWQACGASLALRHGGPELEHLSYNQLQELFRCGHPSGRAETTT